MQEFHVQIPDKRAFIEYLEFARICERAEDCRLNHLCLADSRQFFKVFRWHRDYHPFLRFGEPDFPRRESLVFEGYPF